jgi:mono/diheme cytochrome c family protein
MNAEAQPTTTMPEGAEPTMGSRGLPMWLIILAFILVFLGLSSFDINSGWFRTEVYLPNRSMADLQPQQPAVFGPNPLLGKRPYEQVCGLCHQPDGMGKPGQFPPLVGSEWVNGAPARLIRIPLLGINGNIKVKGQPWALSMPAMGASMSDEDLAAVLTYIRMTWGNTGTEITPAMVKAVRGQLGGRSQPLDGEADLLKLPEK